MMSHDVEGKTQGRKYLMVDMEKPLDIRITLGDLLIAVGQMSLCIDQVSICLRKIKQNNSSDIGDNIQELDEHNEKMWEKWKTVKEALGYE